MYNNEEGTWYTYESNGETVEYFRTDDGEITYAEHSPEDLVITKLEALPVVKTYLGPDEIIEHHFIDETEEGEEHTQEGAEDADSLNAIHKTNIAVDDCEG